MKKKVALLGATGHIGKNLLYYFLENKDKYEIVPVIRNAPKLLKFLEKIDNTEVYDKRLDFSEWTNNDFDFVINCVGISNSDDLKNAGQQILDLTESIDNSILSYLKQNKDAMYINMSSGAVYLNDFSEAVDNTSQGTVCLNNFSDNNYYAMSKFYSECKHRAYKNSHIIDVRVFSFFSPYIDLKSNFLLTQIIGCLLEKKTFITDNIDIFRDYIHPNDLFDLIIECMKVKRLNKTIDAYSIKPVSKMELLDFFQKKYGLNYEIQENINVESYTGIKYNYYSKNKENIEINYSPKFKSIDSISYSFDKIIEQNNNYSLIMS